MIYPLFLGIMSGDSFEAFSEGDVSFNDKFYLCFEKKKLQDFENWDMNPVLGIPRIFCNCWQPVRRNKMRTLLCELTYWKPIWVKRWWTNLRYFFIIFGIQTWLQFSAFLRFLDLHLHNASFWSSVSGISIFKWSIFGQRNFPSFYLTE